MKFNTVTLFVVIFIAIILGVILTSQLAKESNSVVTLDPHSETLDLSQIRVIDNGYNMTTAIRIKEVGYGTWKYDNPECIPTNVTLLNQTGLLTTSSTDYTYVASNATLLINRGIRFNSSTNSTTLGYTRCPDSYITTSFGRSSLNTTNGFFALMVLLIAIGGTIILLRREGIIDMD